MESTSGLKFTAVCGILYLFKKKKKKREKKAPDLQWKRSTVQTLRTSQAVYICWCIIHYDLFCYVSSDSASGGIFIPRRHCWKRHLWRFVSCLFAESTARVIYQGQTHRIVCSVEVLYTVVKHPILCLESFFSFLLFFFFFGGGVTKPAKLERLNSWQ